MLVVDSAGEFMRSLVVPPAVESLLHFRVPEGRVAEVLVTFDEPVTAEDGKVYIARACGGPMAGNGWQGWIEFVPATGDPVRSARETTQPNRQDTIYWATGLTPIFLQGSLRRALNPTVRPLARPSATPYFDGPAEPFVAATSDAESILDPFSVYRKGEALLRRQLSALAGWHLVNIIRRYGLSGESSDRLSARQPAELVELIIDAVRTPQTSR